MKTSINYYLPNAVSKECIERMSKFKKEYPKQIIATINLASIVIQDNILNY